MTIETITITSNEETLIEFTDTTEIEKIFSKGTHIYIGLIFDFNDSVYSVSDFDLIYLDNGNFQVSIDAKFVCLESDVPQE